MINLESNRLFFRLWEEADFPRFAKYFASSGHTLYIGGVKSSEQAWRNMVSYIGHYYLKGYSYLAVVEKNSLKLIGGIGLWNSDPWPEMELGYWLLPEMQGKGFATEAAGLVKDYAFNQLKVSTLVSYIHPENANSVKVAAKLGGFYDGDIQLLDFGRFSVYRYKS